MESRFAPLPRRHAVMLLTVLIALGLVACWFIVRPFLPALVWAFTLAVLLIPVEERLRRIMRWPLLSICLALLLAALIVVVPVFLVSGALFAELVDSAGRMATLLSPERWLDMAQRYEPLAPLFRWLADNLDPQPVVQSLAGWLGERGGSFIQGSILGFVNLLLTFYFLFYLLRDRAQALAATAELLPFTAAEFDLLKHRSVDTVLATVYGTLVVSALQGVLGGLMFWWLGLPSPLFWGVIMGLLGIVPFLGAFLVWVPAAVMLMLDGQVLSALLLVAWGTLVIGLIDNIFYPILVGRRIAMHSMVSFVAIVGGLMVFGTHGVVLGPVIVALTRTLMVIWRSRLAGMQASAPDTSVPVPAETEPPGPAA